MKERSKRLIVAGGVALALLGCSGNDTPAGPLTTPAKSLTLTLDASLDGGGDVKAASLSKLELLSAAGTVVKTWTGTGTSGPLDLGGVSAGDYFIRVNNLADDLVPTRIDDPSKDLGQSVGTKLRTSLIGPSADPTYRVKTFSKGQGEHEMVKYGDGTVAPPERFNYVIVSLKTTAQKIEIRIAPTGVLVLEKVKSVSDVHPFATWVLGGNNHGKPANYVNDASCNLCHGNLDVHPAQYGTVSQQSGWCFKCHYGKDGDPNGFVDKAFNVP